MSDQKNNGPEGQSDNQSQQDRPQTNSTNSAGSSITKLLEFLLSLPGAAQISEMVTKNFLPIGISSLVGIGIGIGTGKLLPSAPDSGQQNKLGTTTSSAIPSKPPSAERVTSYREQKIDMNEVCENPKVYKLDERIISDKSFRTGQPILANDGRERIWPVFRWECQYTVLNQLGSAGLDLDKFCQTYFSNKKYYASFHNYEDPKSYYCVDSKVPAPVKAP
jgi:hypothetical protein